MKVLITGASGLLGRAVHQQCLDAKHDVKALAFTRSDPSKGLVKLDLTDNDALVNCLTDFQPDVIIHTAAERRPDVVEKDPAAAQVLNVDVPANLAKAASQLPKAPLLVNISTDYVFDGSKPPYKVDDEPNPLNAYGVSKLQGERSVSQHAKPGTFTNLRVPVLYGKTTSNDESAVNVLLNAIQPAPGSGVKKCDAYAVRYPTSVEDIARALLKLAQVYIDTGKDVPPTIHFSAKEAMTKYDMCLVLSRIANSVGFETRTDLLDPEYEVDPMAATARPRHCKLDTSVLEEYGVPIQYTPFEDWWRPYLTEKYQEKKAEEARLAAEAEAKRKQEEEEEEERKRKQAQEAERQRILEEEKRKKAEEEEAQRKRQQEEAEEERKAKEAEVQAESAPSKQDDQDTTRDSAPRADDTDETTPGASSAAYAPGGNQSATDPGSPHPSFNSLKARPTPPATSGLPSPTSSLPPSSIKSGHRAESPTPGQEPTSSADSKLEEASTTSRAVVAAPAEFAGNTPTGSVMEESPLDLAAARERERLGQTVTQRSLSASSQARLTSLTDEASMFGGTVRKQSIGGGAGLLDVTGHASHRGRAGAGPGGQDSDEEDVYGQPSPREPTANFPRTPTHPSAGGSTLMEHPNTTTASINSDGSLSAPRASSDIARSTLIAQAASRSPSQSQSQSQSQAQGTPPRLYHRPSFDEPEAARARLAYEAEHRRNWEFTVKVGDPRKIGDPMTAHIVYTVRTHTNHPSFRSSQFSVLRRYRDFRWLHAALVQNNPGIIVPPVPEKVSIGRFAVELIEARRIGLEVCINKIANHPLLQQDPDFQLFLESDNFANDVKQRDAVKGAVVTPEQKTYKSWGSVLLGTVVPSSSSLSSGSLSVYKYEERDEWFNSQKIYLDSLESSLKGMVKSITFVSNQRKVMVESLKTLSEILLSLSGSSLSRSLSTCFAGLSEVSKRCFELEDVQSEMDLRVLGTTMYEYERVVGSIRKAFSVRVEVWSKSARLEEEVRKVRSRFEKFKMTSPHSTGSQFQSLLAELTEAESKSLEANRMFDVVSSRCKQEMERLDLERVTDFKKALAQWTENQLEKQEQVVQEWLNYCSLLSRQTGIQVLPPPQPSQQQQQQSQQSQQSQTNEAAQVHPDTNDQNDHSDVGNQSENPNPTSRHEPNQANDSASHPESVSDDHATEAQAPEQDQPRSDQEQEIAPAPAQAKAKEVDAQPAQENQNADGDGETHEEKEEAAHETKREPESKNVETQAEGIDEADSTSQQK